MTPPELLNDPARGEQLDLPFAADDPPVPEPVAAEPDELGEGAPVRYYLDRDTRCDATIFAALPNGHQWDLLLSDGRTMLGVRRGFGSRQVGTFDTASEVAFAESRGQRRTELPTTAPVAHVTERGQAVPVTREQIAQQAALHDQAAVIEGDETASQRADENSPHSSATGLGVSTLAATDGHGLSSVRSGAVPASEEAEKG